MSETRTSPAALFHQAHSYASSASLLNSTEIDSVFPDEPIRFLYGHAIELYLKSFLLLHKISIEELRSREYGHNAQALVEKAIELGLDVDNIQKQQIEMSNNMVPDRYVQAGLYPLLSPNILHDVCKELNEQIGPIIYKDRNLNRKPPSLF